MSDTEKLAAKAREQIKRMTSIGNAKCEYGECYIPSDEAMDAIIQAAIEEATAELSKQFVDMKAYADHLELRAAQASEPWTPEMVKDMIENRGFILKSKGYEAVADAHNATLQPQSEVIELAWGIIANASGGDWSKQSEDWQKAAADWRDRFVVNH